VEGGREGGGREGEGRETKYKEQCTTVNKRVSVAKQAKEQKNKEESIKTMEVV